MKNELNEQYRHGGEMVEWEEPYVRDCIDEMRRAAQDHRILRNALKAMGSVDDDYWTSPQHDFDLMARLKCQFWNPPV